MNQTNIKKSMLILTVLIVASMTTAQVYAMPGDFQLPSPSLKPGHPLYGVDLFMEEYIEVPLARLTGGQKGEAEKRLRLAEERLAEIEAVANETSPSVLEKLRNRYMHQMNRTRTLANITESLDLDCWITNRTVRHIEVLTQLRARVPEQAYQGIDMALQSSTQSFGDSMRKMTQSIQRMEGQGVNATQLHMELEALRNQVQERIIEFQHIRENMPTPGHNIDIEMPKDPLLKGNRTQRGPS